MLIERLVGELEQPMIVIDEALKALKTDIRQVTGNPNSLVILTMPEVFKLCGWLDVPIHIPEGAGLVAKLQIISDLHAVSDCDYAVFGTEIITATASGLTVTPINYRLSLIPALFYAVLGTFWLQNRTNRHAGLVTGAYLIRAAGAHLGSTDRPSVTDLAAAIDSELRKDQF
jgi:hypothetical protein